MAKYRLLRRSRAFGLGLHLGDNPTDTEELWAFLRLFCRREPEEIFILPTMRTKAGSVSRGETFLAELVFLSIRIGAFFTIRFVPPGQWR